MDYFDSKVNGKYSAARTAGERLAFTGFQGRRRPGSIPLFCLRSKD